MYRFAIVAAVALTACLPLREGEDADPRARTRICVRNATAGYGNVIARVGLARYDIMPGQEVCRVSLETGATTVLSARTIGGGANGPMTFDATLEAGAPGCWLWVLDNSGRIPGTSASAPMTTRPPRIRCGGSEPARRRHDEGRAPRPRRSPPSFSRQT